MELQLSQWTSEWKSRSSNSASRSDRKAWNYLWLRPLPWVDSFHISIHNITELDREFDRPSQKLTMGRSWPAGRSLDTSDLRE